MTMSSILQSCLTLLSYLLAESIGYRTTDLDASLCYRFSPRVAFLHTSCKSSFHGTVWFLLHSWFSSFIVRDFPLLPPRKSSPQCFCSCHCQVPPFCLTCVWVSLNRVKKPFASAYAAK
jgi:hypothetical protein